MHLILPLLTAAGLFGTGVYAVLARRNAVLVLMGVELMLNSANLMLVAFDVSFRDELQAGQSLALFIITIAAAEIGLGLAIVLLVFRELATVNLDEMRTLADDDPGPAVPGPATAGPTNSGPAASGPAASGPATSGAAPSRAATSGAGR